ncbi:hypothetical protein ACFYO2_26555 [Streptomyces sp. NPDC006602]|uniref:hypothetical protein n=1 Tax=Streptomyces sp. NPDC006602 TaxID=3364751 RepID=UPI003698127C
MKNYRVQWTEDGQEHESAVAYNDRTAAERVAELEAREGIANARSVPVKPGE